MTSQKTSYDMGARTQVFLVIVTRPAPEVQWRAFWKGKWPLGAVSIRRLSLSLSYLSAGLKKRPITVSNYSIYTNSLRNRKNVWLAGWEKRSECGGAFPLLNSEKGVFWGTLVIRSMEPGNNHSNCVCGYVSVCMCVCVSASVCVGNSTRHICHRKCCTESYSAGTVGMSRCRTVDRAVLCCRMHDIWLPHVVLVYCFDQGFSLAKLKQNAAPCLSLIELSDSQLYTVHSYQIIYK